MTVRVWLEPNTASQYDRHHEIARLASASSGRSDPPTAVIAGLDPAINLSSQGILRMKNDGPAGQARGRRLDKLPQQWVNFSGNLYSRRRRANIAPAGDRVFVKHAAETLGSNQIPNPCWLPFVVLQAISPAATEFDERS
jgi:hypothetical protein